MILKYLSLFIYLLSFCSLSYGQAFLNLSEDSTTYTIQYRVQTLEDGSRSLNIARILENENQAKFAYAKNGNMNYGFSSANYWFKLKITADKAAREKENWLIQMKNPNIDSLSAYIFNSKNELIKEYHTGDVLNFEERPLIYHKFLLPLPFQDADSLTVYLKTAGYYAKEHHFTLITEKQVLSDAQYALGLAIFLIAILCALLAYNTLLYISIRDITYFHYVAYLTCITLYLVAVSGIGYQFLYPFLPLVANYLTNFANVGAIIFAMLFSYHFLKVKEVLPKWVEKSILAFVGYNIGLLVFLSVTIWFKFLLVVWFKFLLVALAFFMIAIIVLGVWTLLLGIRTAKFFLWAWSMLLLSVVVGVLKLLGVLTEVSIDTTVQVGTALEALLLSFGLADRIKTAERQREQAQAQVIVALKENESIIQSQNQILEQKVQERTLQLEATNADLNQTNEELQVTIEMVNEQKELIEAKNKDITDSIRYARRIQESILPPIAQMKNTLNCFVLYRPKDIVSGDFYWFAAKDDLCIVAAVDCTGHGVPGAFMSVLGNSLLNQIVNENDIVNPSEILLQLHKRVGNALRQRSESIQSQDGMDIGLCVIEKDKKIIGYAGAKRPLFLVRNGELSEMKVNKNSIGGKNIVENFESVTLQLQANDLIYLTTDGYADQFGGDEKRKYMSKNFKNLLQNIHQLDLAAQEQALTREFETWKGEEKQTDDILVIGIKFD